MDQRERINDPDEAFKLILDGRQLRMWTSLPGIIIQYYPDTQTADVQPSIQGVNTDAGGNTTLVNLPKLLDCPVQFPSGGAGGTTGQQSTGGSTGGNTLGTTSTGNTSTTSLGTSTGGNQPYGVTLTFPVQQGDECLITFTSRGFDNWWQSGGIQPPTEARMHDLSDGFVQLGYRSQPRKLSNVSTTTCQLRSDDGKTIFELDAKNEILTLKDTTGKNHATLDIKNKNFNVTTENTAVLQDPNAQNFIQLDNKNHNLNITVQGNMNFKAAQFNFNGPIAQSNGGITGPSDVVTSAGHHLNTHVHPGVQTGPGTTGTPQG